MNAVSDGEELLVSNNVVVEKTAIIQKAETFTIKANYRDPFLDKVFKSRVVKKVVKAVKKQPVIWPKIEFKGVFKKPNSSDLLGIISLNDKEEIAQKGATIDEVKIISINQNEIKINFKGESKKFLKQ
ncbi:MAG: hypothetical protein COC01_06030 [Bacteroidetes bacterium]|nr:MAG: hypothetical protein COC01_06030 [Bacteroidota bacterium]